MAELTGDYLQKLSIEQKEEICLMRLLQGTTYDAIKAHLEDTYEYSTTKGTISNFFRSESGEGIMETVHDKVRKEFKDKPLVEKATRVIALRDQMARIQALISGVLPIDHEAWVGYSQEFRQYAKMIRDEMEGIRLSVDDGKKSFAERVIEGLPTFGGREDTEGVKMGDVDVRELITGAPGRDLLRPTEKGSV